MKITATDMLQVLRDVGVDKNLVAGLKHDVPFLDQGLDSIDMPAAAMLMEKRFQVDMSHIDGSQLRTIDDCVRFVNG